MWERFWSRFPHHDLSDVTVTGRRGQLHRDKRVKHRRVLPCRHVHQLLYLPSGGDGGTLQASKCRHQDIWTHYGRIVAGLVARSTEVVLSNRYRCVCDHDYQAAACGGCGHRPFPLPPVGVDVEADDSGRFPSVVVKPAAQAELCTGEVIFVADAGKSLRFEFQCVCVCVVRSFVDILMSSLLLTQPTALLKPGVSKQSRRL